MSFSFKILEVSDPDQKSEWAAYWHRLDPKHRDVHFLPDFFSAYEEEQRGKAFCAVAEEEGKLFLYPFLRNEISFSGNETGKQYYDIESPYGYSGPVMNAAGMDREFAAGCWEIFGNWCSNNHIITEFCRFHPLIGNEIFASPDMKVLLNRTTVAFDLQTYPEEFFSSSFYLNHRGMIHKAGRERLNFEFISYADNYELFSSKYTDTQVLLKASPETFFSKSFFRMLALFSPDNIKLGCVKRDGKILCAVIVMEGAEFSHLHLMAYYTDESVKGMVNFLYHEIALNAAERGLKFLQVGGGKTTREDDPLLLFKKRLSPVRNSFYIGKRIHDTVYYEKLKMHYQLEHPEVYEMKKGLLQFYR